VHVAATDRRTNGLSPVINHRRANQIHVYTGRLDGPWLSDSVGTTPGWSDRCRRVAGPARRGAASSARAPAPRCGRPGHGRGHLADRSDERAESPTDRVGHFARDTVGSAGKYRVGQQRVTVPGLAHLSLNVTSRGTCSCINSNQVRPWYGAIHVGKKRNYEGCFHFIGRMIYNITYSFNSKLTNHNLNN